MKDKLTINRSSRENLGVSIEGIVQDEPISITYYPEGNHILRIDNSFPEDGDRYRMGTGDKIPEEESGYSKEARHQYIHSYALGKAKQLLPNGLIIDIFYQERGPKVKAYSPEEC